MGFSDIFKISQIKQENERLKFANANLIQQIRELGVNEYSQTKSKIAAMERETEEKLSASNREITENYTLLAKLRAEIQQLQEKDA